MSAKKKKPETEKPREDRCERCFFYIAFEARGDHAPGGACMKGQPLKRHTEGWILRNHRPVVRPTDSCPRWTLAEHPEGGGSE